MGLVPSLVIDYGCGTGSTSPLLLKSLGAERVIGIDPSVRSIDVARRDFGSKRIQFLPLNDFEPEGDADLVYCNGVFHHIPPKDRDSALRLLDRTLRPGGLFSLWENNPWNPGTQYIMSRLPFDRDAIKLSCIESQRLVRSRRSRSCAQISFFSFPDFSRFSGQSRSLFRGYLSAPSTRSSVENRCDHSPVARLRDLSG